MTSFVHRHQKEATLVELQRAYNQKWALHAMDMEQAIRTNQAKLGQVLCELTRKANQRLAMELVLRERNERLSNLSLNKHLETINCLQEVHEQLVRRLNQQRVAKKTQAERVRRSSQRWKFEVLQQLERTANQRLAARLMDEEQQARITAERKRTLLHEIHSFFNKKLVQRLEEDERARRINQFPTLKSAVKAMLSNANPRDELHECIQRLGNQRKVVRAMEFERQRLVQRVYYARAMDDMIRKANQQVARESCELEQLRRIWSNQFDRTMAQLTRQQNQQRVKRMVREEQLRREKSSSLLSKDAVLKQSALRLGKLHEELERKQNQRNALRAMNIEQQRRVFMMRMDEILNELQRRLNGQCADKLMDNEQVVRITEELKRQMIHQLARKCVQKQVTLAVEAERKRRLEIIRCNQQTAPDKENYGGRFGLNCPKTKGLSVNALQTVHMVQHNKKTIHAQLTKQVAMKDIGNSLKQHADHRTLMKYKEIVFTDIERVYNQNLALKAMKGEQQERITAIQFAKVLDQLEREESLRTVLRQVEEERQEQILLHQYLGTGIYLGRTAWDRVHEEVRSLGNHKRAIEREEAERQYRLARNHMHKVIESIERKMNGKRALRAMDDEQVYRVSCAKMRIVLTEMERSAKRQEARMACDVEQVRRVRLFETGDVDISLAAKMDLVHEQLCRCHNAKLVALEIEAEREYQINRMRYSEVLAQVVREYNIKTAKRLCDGEQTSRVARVNMDFVLDELIRRQNQQRVFRMCNDEQSRRVAQQSILDVDTLKWMLHSLPRFTVQEQLLRKLNARLAVSLTRRERSQNISQQWFSRQVLAQLIRKIAQRNAWQACTLEQEYRELRLAKEKVNAELHRVNAISSVVNAAETERLRRTSDHGEQMRIMRIQLGVARIGPSLRNASQLFFALSNATWDNQENQSRALNRAGCPTSDSDCSDSNALSAPFASKIPEHKKTPSGEWIMLEEQL